MEHGAWSIGGDGIFTDDLLDLRRRPVCPCCTDEVACRLTTDSKRLIQSRDQIAATPFRMVVTSFLPGWPIRSRTITLLCPCCVQYVGVLYVGAGRTYHVRFISCSNLLDSNAHDASDQTLGHLRPHLHFIRRSQRRQHRRFVDHRSSWSMEHGAWSMEHRR